MAENIRLSLGNLATMSVVAILAIGFTVWILRFLSSTSIPVLSHLAVGGQAFVGA